MSPILKIQHTANNSIIEMAYSFSSVKHSLDKWMLELKEYIHGLKLKFEVLSAQSGSLNSHKIVIIYKDKYF